MFDRVYIGFNEGTGPVSYGIQMVDASRIGNTRKPSRVNHVYYLFADHEPRQVYESHFKGGVQITPWAKVIDAVAEHRIRNYTLVNLELSRDDVNRLYDACTDFHGKGYDSRLIIAYYWWASRNRGKDPDRIPWWLRLGNNDLLTCNELVGTAGRNLIPRMSEYNITWTPEKLFERFVGLPSAEHFLRCPGRFQAFNISDLLLEDE